MRFLEVLHQSSDYIYLNKFYMALLGTLSEKLIEDQNMNGMYGSFEVFFNSLFLQMFHIIQAFQMLDQLLKFAKHSWLFQGAISCFPLEN